MDKSILSVVIPLAIASGTGLAFIAYKHPREYKPLAIGICVVLMCLLYGGIIWDISNGAAHNAAMESNAIALEKIRILSDAIRAHSVPLWWNFVIFIIFFFVLFLLSFPSWLLSNVHQNQQSPRREVDEDSDTGSKEK